MATHWSCFCRASEERCIKGARPGECELELVHTKANILAELSAAKLSRDEFDSALRLASRGTRVDLALPGMQSAPPRPPPHSPPLFRRRNGALLSARRALGLKI